MPKELTHEILSEELDSTFRLRFEGEEIELKLCEVSPLRSGNRQETFSIVFRGPEALVLPQRTYRLEHDHLAPFDLMIVPIRGNRDGVYYEAVFNRLIE